MSHNSHLLLIGRHQYIVEKVLGLLSANSIKATPVYDDEEAIRLFERKKFDGVVIGNGVEHSSREYIKTRISMIDPDANILEADPENVLSQIYSNIS